ncbi:MAG: divergent polysaccharide deacetylase family protein [Desulfobacterales bacterium]
MTKKKSARGNSAKKAIRKKKSRRRQVSSDLVLVKILASLTILVVLVVGAGVLTHYILIKTRPATGLPPPPVKPAPQPVVGLRHFEVFPKEDRPPAVPLPKPRPAEDARPKVAIIIDDLGYDRRMAKKFLDLDSGLTFSVLPHTPHTQSIAATVLKKGGEVMLHLPMEPLEYPAVDPGPGALLSSMSADELLAQLRDDLEEVPGIKGINNHMGSKLTAEAARLYQVFSVLKQQGLFFIDSRSTGETVGRASARLFQLPFAERDVFIDHVQDPDFMRAQIKGLIQTAQKNGEAIGIAHPSKTTLRILEEMLPLLKKEVQLVPASHLVHVIS